MGELVSLREIVQNSPQERLKRVTLREGYVWQHDVLSPEFSQAGAEARSMYLVLVVCAEAQDQTITMGLRELARRAGMVCRETTYHGPSCGCRKGVCRYGNDGRERTKKGTAFYQNARRALEELAGLGLLAIRKDVVGGCRALAAVQSGDRRTAQRYGRSTYVLLCPPSVLRGGADPRQLSLPFRRLNYAEADVLRKRDRGA